MRVEEDDPGEDWTRPGVFQVSPGTYRVPLPLPTDGLRAVNAYVLVSGSTVTLIDPGWALPSSRARLGMALAALGITMSNVERCLATHIHRDHYTLAVALRSDFPSIELWLGEGDEESLRLLQRETYRPFEALDARLVTSGASHLAQRLRSSAVASVDPSLWRSPDVWTSDGDVILVPNQQLHAISTPGHTRGHTVFDSPTTGTMFTGDHVLPHITPSIGFEQASTSLPLRHYLASLNRVRQLPDRQMLPAHGPVSESVHARIDELLAHHADRLNVSMAALSERPATAYDVACGMTWTSRQLSLSQLDVFNQSLAVAETLAHLEFLAHRGAVTVIDEGPPRLFDQGLGSRRRP